jgi:polysaccharide pyruvyl transferase WcaK-like protein
MSYETIGLLDHMGFGNLGDAAIQESVIANIRKRIPHAKLIGFSSNPEDTSKRHGIPAYPITWSYPGRTGGSAAPASREHVRAGLKRAIGRVHAVYGVLKRLHDILHEAVHLLRSYKRVRALDLLVISGGGQICELWGGAWGAPWNVLKFCLLARLSGTPLFILDVGAWPLKSRTSKLFAKWSVRLADYTAFRDSESKQLLEGLHVRRKIEVFPDAAYGFRPPRRGMADRKGNSRGRVALNPLGFCDPRIWPRKDEAVYKAYLEKMAAFILWVRDLGFELHIFSSDYSTDLLAMDDLAKMAAAAPSLLSAPLLKVYPELTLDELIETMSGMDYFVTSKFHGVIFSHILGVPVAALSYHPKIQSLMAEAGHPEFCMDVESFRLEDLKQAFSSLEIQREPLQSLCYRAASGYYQMLQGQFDRLFAVPSVSPPDMKG